LGASPAHAMARGVRCHHFVGTQHDPRSPTAAAAGTAKIIGVANGHTEPDQRCKVRSKTVVDERESCSDRRLRRSVQWPERVRIPSSAPFHTVPYLRKRDPRPDARTSVTARRQHGGGGHGRNPRGKRTDGSTGYTRQLAPWRASATARSSRRRSDTRQAARDFALDVNATGIRGRMAGVKARATCGLHRTTTPRTRTI
jgi:hypothetical protein